LARQAKKRHLLEAREMKKKLKLYGLHVLIAFATAKVDVPVLAPE
jgi:hypothetical protein